MATSNFYVNNALAIYAIGMNDSEYEMEVDEIIEDITDGIISQDYNWYKNDEYSRSYRGGNIQYFLAKDFYKTFHGEDIVATVKLGYRVGYYEGACLDYTIELTDDYITDIDNRFYLLNGNTEELAGTYIEEKINDEYYADKSFPKAKLTTTKNIMYWLDTIVKEVENVCKDYCESKYRTIGVFSNGEAIYEKID